MVFVVVQIGKKKQKKKHLISVKKKYCSGTGIEIGIVSKKCGMVRNTRAKSEKVT